MKCKISGGQNTQTKICKKSGGNIYYNTTVQNSKKLGGKIQKTEARFTILIEQGQHPAFTE